MIYVFKCERHGEFETVQPMGAEHKADCPKCHSPGRRVFTPSKLSWGANCWDYDKDGLGNNLVLRHHA